MPVHTAMLPFRSVTNTDTHTHTHTHTQRDTVGGAGGRPSSRLEPGRLEPGGGSVNGGRATGVSQESRP